MPETICPATRGEARVSLRSCITDSLMITFHSQVMAMLKDGTLKVTASEWPAFLYDDKVEYDLEEKDKGLLQNELLFRVSIFPSGSDLSAR
jgi:hypothetical protein